MNVEESYRFNNPLLGFLKKISCSRSEQTVQVDKRYSQKNRHDAMALNASVDG